MGKRLGTERFSQNSRIQGQQWSKEELFKNNYIQAQSYKLKFWPQPKTEYKTTLDNKTEKPLLFSTKTENRMLKNEKSANRGEHQNRKPEVFWHENRKTDLKNSQNRKNENPNVPLFYCYSSRQNNIFSLVAPMLR